MTDASEAASMAEGEKVMPNAANESSEGAGFQPGDGVVEEVSELQDASSPDRTPEEEFLAQMLAATGATNLEEAGLYDPAEVAAEEERIEEEMSPEERQAKAEHDALAAAFNMIRERSNEGKLTTPGTWAAAGIVPDHAKCFRHRRSPRFDLRHTMPGRVYLCLLPSPSGEGGPQGRMRAECALLPIRGQLRRLCPHQSLSATASPEGEAPARKKRHPSFPKRWMPFYSIIFQPVALAAPDEERVDGHGADAQLGHNGPAAGAQQLALLDIFPGLDVQCGQAVEDAPEARAVVDDNGSCRQGPRPAAHDRWRARS